jgi:AraC-like DNA-binding protein
MSLSYPFYYVLIPHLLYRQTVIRFYCLTHPNERHGEIMHQKILFNQQPKKAMYNQTTRGKINPWNLHPICTIAAVWDEFVKRRTIHLTWKSTIAISFIELIELHHRHEHSPAFYAQQLNISNRYLGKVCQQHFRQAPKDCIHLRLMKEACELLKKPELEIKEVCWSLGFTDPSYFARFFKIHGGITPDCYRKTLLQNKE